MPSHDWSVVMFSSSRPLNCCRVLCAGYWRAHNVWLNPGEAGALQLSPLQSYTSLTVQIPFLLKLLPINFRTHWWTSSITAGTDVFTCGYFLFHSFILHLFIRNLLRGRVALALPFTGLFISVWINGCIFYITD